MSKPRRKSFVLGLLLAGVVAIAAVVVVSTLNRPKPLTRAQIAISHQRHLIAAEQAIAKLATDASAVPLPRQAGAPAPRTGGALFKVTPQRHLVFGYLPYWMLGTIGPSDIENVSELAYFSISLNGDGSFEESGPGWADLGSSSLSDVVSQAHQIGDRVLVTVSADSPTTIAQLVASPTAASDLASALSAIVGEHGFDGVDLDIEGRSSSERDAFVRFVTTFSGRFRALQPGKQIVINTYPESAGSSSDFFDVARLAPQVNQMFVMAYDMDNPAVASSNDPLLAPSLGLSDVQSLMQYTKVVPRNQILLGMPYYGWNFATVSSVRAAATLNNDPVAVLYSSIASSSEVPKWDPTSASAYVTLSDKGQWQQTWFDDPTSIAVRTALATDFGLAGVGVWALGFEGSSTSMLSALAGSTTPLRPGSTSG